MHSVGKFNTPEEVVDFIRNAEITYGPEGKRGKIEFVDLRFMDFPGLWQHLTVPADAITVESFTQGFGFDGSSLRGWQAINESDMLIVPVANTAVVDPFLVRPTLMMICDIKSPIDFREYSRDPRSVARKCEAYLAKSGIADRAYFGPELEFFIFDHVRYDQTVNSAFYFVDSSEGIWNRGSDDPSNRGYKVRLKEGYFPVPPTDQGQDIRSEMVSILMQCGIEVETHHHEVATGGQAEIDMIYDTLVNMSDKVMLYKYITRGVAAKYGKTVTFMPKPLFQDNGSGMHTHFSLWKGNTPLFAGDKYAGLSDIGLWAIGGILKHAPSLLAFTNPTTNSYKRLVPGYEAPVNLVYSSRNRSAAIRIPMYSDNPRTKRLEFRCPDSSCNPYLAFSAMTMAALDGIRNQIDPGDPIDKDIYKLEPEEIAKIESTPPDLDAALDALEADHDYLLEGDVFTDDVIYYWIKYKRENEVEALRQRPHPFEFCMYFDL
ncbi:MAG: type I glutamate--ammonia ligase [Planctomycetes bacterium]|nr:type I glutamate--ammonia ligase [Planctomycetota bacterium]